MARRGSYKQKQIGANMILDEIKSANDIKKISEAKLPILADEIRQFLIEKISETGGHLGSNLGAVELTMALHLSLNLPEDQIVWDVGHQAYTHKILTGRKNEFDTLRKYGGLAGFPKRNESDCDIFNTGHSSTSISAGLGLVKARDIKGENRTVVAVIGDGSLTGGLAYEALNNASKLDTNYIIVLNDNNMSISENVGGVSKYLNGIRTADGYLDLKENVFSRLMNMPGGEGVVKGIRKTKSTLKSIVVPGMFFEDMGITYLGPVNGHDIHAMREAFKDAKRCKGAVLVHVVTEKGKGYAPAERHPARFHGTEPFVIETGIPKKKKTVSNYTDVFSTVMMKLGERHPDVVAITAAMSDGTGLKRFRKTYPDRFFDVGIAEEHAVTFAAGLAVGGLKPVVCIYSSFLQRAYDQMMHDVCIQNLPVVFAIDRAGIVGSDGETHQGVFDLSFLCSMPNMTVMAPKNKWELSDMMKFAIEYDGPIAVRYPRGTAYAELKELREPIALGKSEMLYGGEEVALVAIGSMVKTAVEVREKLKEQGKNITVVNGRFVKPVDEEMLETLSKTHSVIITMEENVASGAYGERCRAYLDSIGYTGKLINVCIPDRFVVHGNVDILKRELGIDVERITKLILENC